MKLLIVVDMQKDFVDGSLGTKEAQAIVPKVIEKINNWDGTVVTTMDTHNPNYLETAEGKKLPVEHCIRKTEGWAVVDDVYEALLNRKKDRQQSMFFRKETFGSTDLFFTLMSGLLMTEEDKNYEEIQLVGLCTDICVISNAMMAKAFFPETPIIVDASCCAGVTPESHKRALEAMKTCQIDIINEKE